MIPAKTRYKTHDGELLAIVEALKDWRHYLEDCQPKILVLTSYNNLRRFMETNNLSSRWAHVMFAGLKSSPYYFRIDYRQGKADGAADAVSHFPQKSPDKEESLWAENIQILHRLQSLLTNASLSGLSLSCTSLNLTLLHQVLIYGTHVLPQLREFWDMFRAKLVNNGP